MKVVDQRMLADLVGLALETTASEYPHKLDQELNSDSDLLPPRRLNPSFYGCYDWHSAVHSHWLLVRAVHRGLSPGEEPAVLARLNEHLSQRRLEGELAFFSGASGRVSERPYGWAWLLLLHAECKAGVDAPSRSWAAALEPLATLLEQRLCEYLRTIPFPLRIGTHGNTAFSLQLALTAARRRGDERAVTDFSDIARRLFAAGGRGQWSDPPAGDAFLSVPLVEVALLADALTPDDFFAWLDRSLPEPERGAWAPPRFRPNGEDPGTVHLEGLLISRAWCLVELIRQLPAAHPVAALAREAIEPHLELVARLRPGDGFSRRHWLPTFLLYLDEQLRRLPD